MNDPSYISCFNAAQEINLIRAVTNNNEANVRARPMKDRSGIDQIVDPFFVTKPGYCYDKRLVAANPPDLPKLAARLRVELHRWIDAGMNDARILRCDMMPLDEVILHGPRDGEEVRRERSAHSIEYKIGSSPFSQPEAADGIYPRDHNRNSRPTCGRSREDVRSQEVSMHDVRSYALYQFLSSNDGPRIAFARRLEVKGFYPERLKTRLQRSRPIEAGHA